MRAWRKDEAAKTGKPAFIVFDDAVLRNVVIASPQSIPELLTVSGIDPEKADRYGAAIVALCRDSPNSATSTAQHSVKPSPQTRAVAREPLPTSGSKQRTSPVLGFDETTPTFHRERPAAPDPAVELTAQQQELDAELRAWRKSESERIGLPQFFVLGSSALRSIVLMRPHSLGQLQSIAGIGPDKAEKFGSAILQLCNS